MKFNYSEFWNIIERMISKKDDIDLKFEITNFGRRFKGIFTDFIMLKYLIGYNKINI